MKCFRRYWEELVNLGTLCFCVSPGRQGADANVSYWIGATDWPHETNFHWVDGTDVIYTSMGTLDVVNFK